MLKFYSYYKKEIIFKLMKKFKYKSIMQVPKIKKINLNIGLGKFFNNKKILDQAVNNLKLISCQKPIMTKAKKSIAAFKIREGNIIGCKLTLRKKNMWNFFEKLISIAIPRIRDFRGLSIKSFDNFGNYNLGIHDQNIFPEINFNYEYTFGMNITIVISSKSKYESKVLLKYFNFPFKKVKNK